MKSQSNFNKYGIDSTKKYGHFFDNSGNFFSQTSLRKEQQKCFKGFKEGHLVSISYQK